MKFFNLIFCLFFIFSCKSEKYFILRVENIRDGKVIVKNGDEILQSPCKILENSEVAVDAIANSGFFFEKWYGDIKGSESNVKIKIDSDKFIGAFFSDLPILNLSSSDNGYVVVKSGEKILAAPYQVNYGEILTLEAIASSGYGFTNWELDVYSDKKIIDVKMDRSRSIKANFKQPELFLSKKGEGDIIVRNDEKIFSAPYKFLYGEKIYIEAIPKPNYYLRYWKGDVGGSAKTITILMEKDFKIDCEFELTDVRDVRFYLTCESGIGGDKSPVMKKILDVSESEIFIIGYDGISSNYVQREVSSFSIARYETTYWLWYKVREWAKNSGYNFTDNGCEGKSENNKTPTELNCYHPVAKISWRDTIVWINALNEMLEFEPVYCSDFQMKNPIKIIPESVTEKYDALGEIDNPYINWNAFSYRLPTEAEWEYCARKSINNFAPGNFASGAIADNVSERTRVAWYADVKTVRVGTKSPNYLGLYDMSGNIAEWCWDIYGENYGENNRGALEGDKRVFRGGGFNSGFSNIKTSFRDFEDVKKTDDFKFGFRLAKTLK